MLIYRGIVEVITECSHGRAPHAHRETPDEGLPRQNSPPDCFASHPAFRLRKGFRSLLGATRGAAPRPCQPFEKGWI